jgi:hypothetical protein
MADEIERDSSLTDQLKQKFHAQKLRDDLRERQAAAKDPEGKSIYDKLMAYARDAKPSWAGKESAAQRNSFAIPANTPRASSPAAPAGPSDTTKRYRSGVEGGSITFVACVDNGDGTFSQGAVTADATFVPS